MVYIPNPFGMPCSISPSYVSPVGKSICCSLLNFISRIVFLCFFTELTTISALDFASFASVFFTLAIAATSLAIRAASFPCLAASAVFIASCERVNRFCEEYLPPLIVLDFLAKLFLRRFDFEIILQILYSMHWLKMKISI